MHHSMSKAIPGITALVARRGGLLAMDCNMPDNLPACLSIAMQTCPCPDHAELLERHRRPPSPYRRKLASIHCYPK